MYMTNRIYLIILIIFILLPGCVRTTKLEVTGYSSNLLRQYTKVFTSEDFDLQVKYVGMNDSSFTFETYLKNKSGSGITLDCSASSFMVDRCSADFERRIKSQSSMKADIVRWGEYTAWLQFKVLGDNPMPCFLNGGTMRLSHIFVLTQGRRIDCGPLEFVPISVRLY